MDSLVYDQISEQLHKHIKDNDIIQTIWNSIRKPQLIRTTTLQKPETLVDEKKDTSSSLVASMKNGNILFHNPSLNHLVKINSMAMSLTRSIEPVEDLRLTDGAFCSLLISSNLDNPFMVSPTELGRRRLNEIYAIGGEELFILDSNWNVTKVINLRTILDFKEQEEETNKFFVTSWQGTMVVAMTDSWMDGGYHTHFGINLLTSQGLLGAPGDWKAAHPLF